VGDHGPPGHLQPVTPVHRGVRGSPAGVAVLLAAVFALLWLFLMLGFAGRDLLGRPLAGGLRYRAVRGVTAVESTTPEARYTAE